MLKRPLRSAEVCAAPATQRSTPRTPLPSPGAHLHAIYINACPHAKLLAKEPQPGHAVKEAVIELERKRFGMAVREDLEDVGPSFLPQALLLRTQGSRRRKGQSGHMGGKARAWAQD